MARRRMLDPSFWDDESVGTLSNDARLLFICCISNADDEGRLTGSAATLKKMCFGFTDATTAQVESWLDEIADAIRGFHRYVVGGRQYIALLNWGSYQRVDHAYESILPEPQNLPEWAKVPKRSEKKRKQTESDSRNGSGDSPNGSRNGSKNDSRNGSADSPNDSENETRQLDREIREGDSEKNKRRSRHPLLIVYERIFAVSVPETRRLRANRRFAELESIPNYSQDFAVQAMELWNEHQAAIWREDNQGVPCCEYMAAVVKGCLEEGHLPGPRGKKAKCPPDCFVYGFEGKTYHIPREHKGSFDSQHDGAIIRQMLAVYGTEVPNA